MMFKTIITRGFSQVRCKGNKMDKSDFYNKIKRDNM